jgi:hypothetical protein
MQGFGEGGGNLRERDYLNHLYVVGRIILMWIFKKQHEARALS